MCGCGTWPRSLGLDPIDEPSGRLPRRPAVRVGASAHPVISWHSIAEPRRAGFLSPGSFRISSLAACRFRSGRGSPALLILLANSAGTPGSAVFPLPGSPILPAFRPIDRWRGFASSRLCR
jgi:hypothetical protein